MNWRFEILDRDGELLVSATPMEGHVEHQQTWVKRGGTIELTREYLASIPFDGSADSVIAPEGFESDSITICEVLP